MKTLSVNATAPESLWKRFSRTYSTKLYFFGFVLEVNRMIVAFYRNWRINRIILYRQILFTGYEALGLISLIAFAISAIMIIEGNSVLAGFGQSKIFYTTFVSIVIRELSCLLTAIIIIARSGTAISTELGNMVINHEVDALLSFGVSPVSYLVTPRVLGVLISLITLTVYFNTVAVFGSWAINTMVNPIEMRDYFAAIIAEISFRDVIATVFKSVLFGYTIAVISSYEGLKVSHASTEVPQRTIKAVVKTLTAIIILDAVITLLLYFS